MPFLPPNQQHQSTKGKQHTNYNKNFKNNNNNHFTEIIQANPHQPAPPVKNGKILLEQSFVAHTLLMASGLGEDARILITFAMLCSILSSSSA